jgi:hypothetical protein
MPAPICLRLTMYSSLACSPALASPERVPTAALVANSGRDLVPPDNDAHNPAVDTAGPPRAGAATPVKRLRE